MRGVPSSTLVVVLGVLAALLAVATLVLSAAYAAARRRVVRLEAALREARDALEAGPPRRGLRRLPELLPAPRDAVRTVWETVGKVRDQGVGGALRSSVEDLAGWAQVERPDLVRLAATDGRVAVLFSDIEGSTTLNDRLGDRAWVRLLARHDRLVRRAVEERGGHVVKTQGDGFMVAFGPADDAVAAALAVQRRLARWRDDPRVAVRIGIHRGQVLHRDNDLFGLHVAYAARVAGLAEGGEVLVSEAVVEALREEDLVAAVDVEGVREVELRGIAGAHRVFPVAAADD